MIHGLRNMVKRALLCDMRYTVLLVVLSRPIIVQCQSEPSQRAQEEAARHRALIVEENLLLDNLRNLPEIPKDVGADRALGVKELAVLLDATDYVVDERKDWADRLAVIDQLGARGHKIAIPSLLAILRNEREMLWLRKAAAGELTYICDPRVVPYLIEDGLGSSEPEIAMTLLPALVQFCGYPPKLEDPDHPGSVIYPPGAIERKPPDPEELEEYLDIWRDWWEREKDNIELNRSVRGVQ